MHGELRPDAFHYNHDTAAVKIINLGSGPRSFEHALTSSGWMTLSREIGAKNKLQYIAPEQTGRMPAEPNSRTDIYGLGVLFWIMLTAKPAFQGDTPIDVVQAVLGRRLPLASSERMDVPDAISKIIQKMTQKQVDDRYHSTSGVKHDLIEVQRLLGEGDDDELSKFIVGSKDVSSFFVLPTSLSGMHQEREKIAQVIERVAKWQDKVDPAHNGVLHFGSRSTSTLSEHIDNNLESGTRSSDTSSQVGRNQEASPSLAPSLSSNNYGTGSNRNSHDLSLSDGNARKPPLTASNSKDSVETSFSVAETQKSGARQEQSSGSTVSTGRVARRPEAHKRRRRRHCELIYITGAAGSGKSSLVQSIIPEIRKWGFFATAKFDRANKAPFEALIRAASALFRQIFSESDVTTEYHNMIRKNLGALWPAVCALLDLPESLIATDSQQVKTSTISQGHTKPPKANLTETSSIRSTPNGSNDQGTCPITESLKAGTNPTSLRFVTIYIEVLRILATNRLICLCLDDVNYADEESLDLVVNIFLRKLGIVIIATCRDETTRPKHVDSLLKSVSDHRTPVRLEPLSEQEVIDYVATTLYRPAEYVLPLAIVCLEKSNGNPFYLKQMLETCNRKGCIWYSWKESVWEFDLDRVFAEFESNSNEQLGTSFITRRLQDLPKAARAILAWASLLGTTFSFELIQRLLTGEFDYADHEEAIPDEGCARLFTPQPVKDVVEGLQATLSASILVPGSTEDQFSFSHDRYVIASASLRECQDTVKMHFLIVQTMIKYPNLHGRSLHARAQHICRAAKAIRQRVKNRYGFRELLSQAAQTAIVSGARPTALEYHETCLILMQPNPWKEDSPDVFYEETVNVYTKGMSILLG